MAAVFGFYCLSGFLMTALMTGPYRGRLAAFFVNRGLRIYPLYWLTLFLTLYYPKYIPEITTGFIRQLFLLNRPSDSPLFIPTSWAVTNELVFYVAIACGVSLTLRRSIVWLAVSVVITAGTFAYLSLTNLDALLVQLYYSLWCGTRPFALGAVAFHTRHRIPPLSLGLSDRGRDDHRRVDRMEFGLIQFEALRSGCDWYLRSAALPRRDRHLPRSSEGERLAGMVDHRRYHRPVQLPDLSNATPFVWHLDRPRHVIRTIACHRLEGIVGNDRDRGMRPRRR
jgi:hypothetical protein